MDPILHCKRIHPKAKIPARQTEQAACYDLSSVEDVLVPPSTVIDEHQVSVGFLMIRTGIILAIPEGHMGRVCSRSGLSLKYHLEVGAGIIDADYRGEIKVKLMNFSDQYVRIFAGDRIAQIAIIPIATPDVVEVEELSETARGDKGFGSTGLSS